MTDRRLKSETYRALKRDFALLVEEIGTQAQAAECTRVDQQTISNYASRNRAEHAPIDVLADLLDATKTDHVMRILADVTGSVVIKLPDGVGPACIIEGSGVMAARLGKVMMEIGQALSDGIVTAEECDRIVRRLYALIVSAHALAEQVKSEVQP